MAYLSFSVQIPTNDEKEKTLVRIIESEATNFLLLCVQFSMF